ncbi:MAG TPA: hypothetical protein VGS41_05495, partial [Chthonomonadales bacterium]|nr:hypothetical protein [Chthonomonadales bacterium]
SRLIQACVAMDPKDRPASVHDVALNLLAARSEITSRNPSVAYQPKATETGPRSPRVNRAATSSEVPSSANGKAGPKPARGIVRVAVALSSLVIACIGLALGMSHLHGKRPVRTLRDPITPPLTSVASQRVVPQQSAPVESPSVDGGLPAPENQSAIFQSAQVEGISADSSGALIMRVHASGEIEGQSGGAGSIVVFFYDQTGKPLKAVEPQSVYANPEGHLSVAISLQITDNKQPFDVNLDVPVDEFPPVDPGDEVKYRIAAFVGDKKVGFTDLYSIPGSAISQAQSEMAVGGAAAGPQPGQNATQSLPTTPLNSPNTGPG